MILWQLFICKIFPFKENPCYMSFILMLISGVANSHKYRDSRCKVKKWNGLKKNTEEVLWWPRDHWSHRVHRPSQRPMMLPWGGVRCIQMEGQHYQFPIPKRPAIWIFTQNYPMITCSHQFLANQWPSGCQIIVFGLYSLTQGLFVTSSLIEVNSDSWLIKLIIL